MEYLLEIIGALFIVAVSAVLVYKHNKDDSDDKEPSLPKGYREVVTEGGAILRFSPDKSSWALFLQPNTEPAATGTAENFPADLLKESQ